MLRRANIPLQILMMGIAGATIAAEPFWTNIGPEGLSVKVIAVGFADHPNRQRPHALLYAGTAGSGVFRSSDGGATWTPVNNGLTALRIDSLAIRQVPRSSLGPSGRYTTEVYAGTPSGVFRSLDGGASWAAMNQGLPAKLGSRSIAQLLIDPAGPIYAATDSGAFRSTDRGENWVAINRGVKPGPAYGLAIDPDPPALLYANLGGSLLLSANEGDDWVDLFPSLFLPLSWATIRPDPFSWSVYMSGLVQVSPFQGLLDGVQWMSLDRGVTWTVSPIWFTDLTFVDGKTMIAAQCGGSCRLIRSFDAGTTWLPANSGLPVESPGFDVRQLVTDPTSPGTVYAASTQGIFRTGPAPFVGPRTIPKRQSLPAPSDQDGDR